MKKQRTYTESIDEMTTNEMIEECSKIAEEMQSKVDSLFSILDKKKKQDEDR